MRVFVISLAQSIDRRQRAAEQLARLNVSFEFYDAVGADGAVEEHFGRYDEQAFLHHTGRNMQPGEAGCYASHLQLWHQCVALQQAIVVMEDDFELDAAFPKALQAIAGVIGQVGYIRFQTETRARKTFVRTIGDFTLWRYTKAPHSAMCYAITPQVAAVLIEHSQVLDAPVDVQVKKFWEHEQPLYGLTPYTVKESELAASTVIGERKKARKSLYVRLQRGNSRVRDCWRRVKFNAGLSKAVRLPTCALPLAINGTELAANLEVQTIVDIQGQLHDSAIT
ncbi:MAG: glycosyltransferase family 25 protein [Pseudomonadales bacterium]